MKKPHLFDFDEIIAREGTSSMKLGMIPEVYPDAPKDSLALWIADMDFACPPCAIDAIRARLDRKILGYSKLVEEDYYQSFIGFEKRIHHLDVEKDWVVFSSGVIPAIKHLVAILTKPDEGVVLTTPGYHPFEVSVLDNSRKLVTSKMIEDKTGRYQIDFADLETKLSDPRNTLFIFCSPQNPTGRVWSVEEITRVHSLCLRHGVKIISDEIHSDLLRRGVTHTPMIALFPDDKTIFTCTAPSKTFNMAGMHFSNILIKDKVIRDDWYSSQPCEHPSPLSIEAAKACFLKGDDWLDELKDYLDGNVAFVAHYLKTRLPKALFYPPDGTYLAWINLKAYSLKDEEIMRRCVENGLLIEGASSFIADAEGHIRLNLAAPRAIIAEAMRRLEKALA